MPLNQSQNDSESLNTLTPPPFSRWHFQMHFLHENVGVSIKISLSVFPRGPVNNIAALIRLVGDKPGRRQAIIWTNDGLFGDVYMRHSSSMSLGNMHNFMLITVLADGPALSSARVSACAGMVKFVSHTYMAPVMTGYTLCCYRCKLRGAGLGENTAWGNGFTVSSLSLTRWCLRD